MQAVFQFSIKNLLAAVTIAAVGVAALLNANGWWEALAWSAALSLLACALLLVVYRRAEPRAFWLGAAVCGGLYLLLLLYSFTADWKNDPLTPNPLHFNSLATTKLLALAYESLLPESRRQEYVARAPSGGSAGQDDRLSVDVGGGTLLGSLGTIEQVVYTPDGGTVLLSNGGVIKLPLGVQVANPSYVQPGKFISIGHTLWLLVIAVVGGKVCQLIYRTQSPGSQP